MQLSALQTWLLSGALATLGCAAPAALELWPRRDRDANPAVDMLALRATASFLASDALAGRSTGSPGGQAAAAYLASECRRLGLAPLDPEGYRQSLPLSEATIVPEATTVRITGPGVA